MDEEATIRPTAAISKKTIAACVENGLRLLDDADFLGGATETPTAFALYILAQEEF